MNLPQRSVLIVAGGTGGHVFPALAAASSLRERGVHVEWLGTERGIESRVVPAAGIPIHFLAATGLRGKSLLQFVKGVANVFAALAQAVKIIRKLQPVCILGMGGFVAGPGGLAAWLLRKPLFIHEQNAVAGTTNRLLAPFSRRVLTGYPIALGGDKNCFIGNPVRREIVAVDEPAARGVGARQALHILVVGGSLGAKAINDVMPAAMATLKSSTQIVIRHQTGRGHLQAVQSQYDEHNVEAHASEFIEDMAAAYAWADLVICRAGALTVAELTATGVASVLVPFPFAIDDHQTANARWLSDNGAALLLPQTELTVERLVALITEFDCDRKKLLSMAQAARALAKPEAADRVAEICLEVASG